MEKTPGTRIAILGAESSGKSTLASMLAITLDGGLVKEYAREYCEKLDHKPTAEDVIHIAEVQIAEYFDPGSSSDFIVYDTALHTSLIWLEDKFSHVPQHLVKAAKTMDFDAIFVCNSDIPWEYDPQREDPHRRNELGEKTKKLLVSLGKDFQFITGDVATRLKDSLYALKKLGLI